MNIPQLTYGNFFIGLIVLIIMCNQIGYHIMYGFDLNWNGKASEVSTWETTTMVIYGVLGVLILVLILLLLIIPLIENWNKTIKF